jgi:Putative MetA-pathway of phenol degradation
VEFPIMVRHFARLAPRRAGLRLPLAAGASLLLAASARADHTVGGIVGGAAGPINAVPAGTLPAGMWSFAFRVEDVELKEKSDQELLAAGAAGNDVHSVSRTLSETLSAAYGVSNSFMLAATLPHVASYQIRSSVDGGGSIDDNGNVSGLGALTLYGQWMIEDKRMSEQPGDNMQLALLAGLKLDTGDKHEKDDNGVPFETEHQPASGSVDPTIGFAATRSFGRSSLTADVIYTFAGEGTDNTDLGDTFRYDLAWSYRLSEGQLKHQHVKPDGSKELLGTADSQWDLALELNGTWKDKLNADGSTDPNSGGNRVMFAPGVRVSYPQHYSLFASVGVPVIDNPNGENHKTQASAVMGVSWAF